MLVINPGLLDRRHGCRRREAPCNLSGRPALEKLAIAGSSGASRRPVIALFLPDRWRVMSSFFALKLDIIEQKPDI
jgi:hypothetical protein